jgi:hypothetical protein
MQGESFQERCARCGREAPRFIAGPEGAAEQGWVTFEGDSIMVVDVPHFDSILPLEIVEGIRQHEGLVQITAWPETKVPSVREVHSHFAGNVCPACLEANKDWDNAQWLFFLAQQGADDES